jgi:hypothetical protein
MIIRILRAPCSNRAASARLVVTIGCVVTLIAAGPAAIARDLAVMPNHKGASALADDTATIPPEELDAIAVLRA